MPSNLPIFNLPRLARDSDGIAIIPPQGEKAGPVNLAACTIARETLAAVLHQEPFDANGAVHRIEKSYPEGLDQFPLQKKTFADLRNHLGSAVLAASDGAPALANAHFDAAMRIVAASEFTTELSATPAHRRTAIIRFVRAIDEALRFWPKEGSNGMRGALRDLSHSLSRYQAGDARLIPALENLVSAIDDAPAELQPRAAGIAALRERFKQWRNLVSRRQFSEPIALEEPLAAYLAERALS